MPILKPNFVARLVCVALGAFCVAARQTRAEPTTAPTPADADARLGIVRFTPPAGWQSEEQAGRDARAFVSPDSTADRQAALVVLLTPPLGQSFDFRARFEKAVNNAADAQPITERGPVVADKSRQGYDTLEQTFAYKNAAGQTVRGRLVAARVGDRLAAFWYLASDDELFKKHADDLAKFLASVHFEDVPATGPATAPSTGPATLPATQHADKPATDPAKSAELQTIEREKAELRQRLSDLESRERGLTGAAAIESSPATQSSGAIDVTDRSRGGAWLRSRYPKRTRLVLTLTPTAPASSEVRTIACDIERLPETAHFTGFPTGTYRLTAKAVTADDKAWPLKVTISPAPLASDWADAVEVDPAKGVSIGVTDVPR
jgi:hypothetical protein